MTSMIGGFKSSQRESRSKVEPCTVEPLGPYRLGLNIINFSWSVSTSGSVVSAANGYEIDVGASASSCKVGYILKITQLLSNLTNDFATILSISGTTVTLSQTFSEAPQPGDTFDILYPSVGGGGGAAVDATIVSPLGIRASTGAVSVTHASDDLVSLTTETNGAGAAPARAIQLGGYDSTLTSYLNVGALASTPSGVEAGLVTRNIPSGTQPVSGTVNIKDSAGTNILSVPDQIWGTGASAPMCMGYDYTNAQYGPLPLGSNGDTVSCTLQYSNTSVSITPTSNTVLGTITTSTSTVTTGSIDGYAGVSVLVWGTHNGVNFTPEVSSDGTNWDTATMTRTASATVNQATGVITANATRAWYVATGGARFFRCRATAWVSGTLNVRITATLDALTQVVTVIPSGTQTVSGTVTANPILTTGAGATTNYKNLDLKATTGVNIKAAKTFIAEMYAYNNTGATVYVKMYNKATAPTSADTPTKVFGVKAGDGTMLIGGEGIECATGFGMRCTTGVADADNTDPAANGCVFTASYI